MIKKIFKKLISSSLLDFYHKNLAIFGALIYKNPSEKIKVIGVTGTNGKSTVISLVSYILDATGHRNGFTSTVEFKIGNTRWLNNKKMTMVGRFTLQALLNRMIKDNCEYAIIETSSEGIKQFRHLSINYDLVAFTNLTPEHLEAHGSFDNYKKCKLKLFKHLTSKNKKEINGESINKVMVVNRDDKYSSEFLAYDADLKIGFSINKESDFQAKNINLHTPTKFSLKSVDFETQLIGEFNIYNILCAISICNSFGISVEDCVSAVKTYQRTPGRMEFISDGQNFKVMIDYAPEVESLRNLYGAIDLFHFEKLIHVLGSCGGGRDRSRQPILGQMAGSKADFVIVTNEDPYDDNPADIIDNVARGAIESGKILDKNLFKIEDRGLAIEKAFELASCDDLVLITGKGAEQFICVKNGKKIPWDDREVARELLKKIINK